MRSPAELTELFRQQGLKVTPQRQCIFRVLHGSEVHPTAEAVYEQARREMPTMSLRTVYQTLNDLAAMGELQQLDLGTGSARFDPNTDAHHHLVCRRCGKVRDVYLDVADPAGEGLGASLGGDRHEGFTVEGVEVVLRGVCGDCSAVAAPAS